MGRQFAAKASILLFLLFLLGSIFAIEADLHTPIIQADAYGASPCPIAQRSVIVPAVVTSQEGDLLQITVTTQPGKGDMLTTIYPLVGLSTQQSQNLAAEEAFKGTGISKNLCEVHFYIQQTKGAPTVDGPSAGLAMAVALRAALSGKQIRQDVSITGAILPGGLVGPVGGIIDKAQASARGGMNAIITPRQQLYENILLKRLGQERNFTSVEVKTLDEAVAIATSPPQSPIISRHELAVEPIPQELQPWHALGQERKFAQIAKALNSLLESRLKASGVLEDKEYGDYFKMQIANNNRLADLGYSYTAANNAFLAQVDAAFLSLPAHEPDIEGEANKVLDCLRTIPAPALNSNNYEWVAGGRARIAWALQKIEDVKKNIKPDASSEERYLAMREVYYAHAWCDAGKQLLEIAQKENGKTSNGSALAAFAKQAVKEMMLRLEQSELADDDMYWHAMIANRSLARQDWAAAIFDAAYVQGAADAAEKLRNDSGINKNASLDNELKSLWGRVYSSQAAYLQAAKSIQEAERVRAVALRMEEHMMQAGEIIEKEGEDKEVADEGSFGFIGNIDEGSKASSQDSAKFFGFEEKVFWDAIIAIAVILIMLSIGIDIGRAIEKSKKEKRK